MIIRDLSFSSSNSLQVFVFEGFRYTLSNVPGYTLQTVTNVGPGLTDSLFTKVDNSSYVFAAPDLSSNMTPGTKESFVLSTVSGSITLTSSNTVTISSGRFLDGCGNTLSNNAYVFYKNEPITPIHLVAPSFTLNTPTCTPALPPGLSFVRDSSSIFRISGTPIVTVPNSNYNFIGTEQGGAKIITTNFRMAISNERIRLNLSGSSIINNMEIGTDISSRVITAIPSAGSASVRYTFPAFPDGIVVTDLSGNQQPSSFTIAGSNDPSYTFILSGAPTSNAAYAFSRIVSGTPIYTVQAARTVPLPIVESSQAFSFGFAPTILFDQTRDTTLYTNIAFDQSSIFFRAQTYFATDVSITNIFSPDLRSDLSLMFVSNESRAYLKGVSGEQPTFAGSATYTISAIDSALNTRNYPATITVVDDSVSFSSPVTDICVNYILSRPTSNAKPGYYGSEIRFVASAKSQLPVTLSAPGLTGTGLFLSNGFLTGTPSTIIPLTDLVVTANVTGSPATATKSIKFAVVDDSFNFTDVSTSNLSFIQNVPITPFQFPVSTLSERSIINYSQTGFPNGLVINPAGVVSGTPTSGSPTAGNVTVNATTGYASASRDFSYNLIPDSMIFVVPQTSYVYQSGDSVGNIDINGVTFSGTTVSNYDLSISPTYGLGVNSSSGILSGTWTTGIPPETLLPPSSNFSISAQAGGLTGILPMSFTANPIVIPSTIFAAYGNPAGETDYNSWLYSTTPADISTFTLIDNSFTTSAFADIRIKNNDPQNNVILGVTVNPNQATSVFKGTRLDNLSSTNLDPGQIYYPNFTTLAYSSGSTWFMAGTMADGIGNNLPAVVRSDDDGSTWDMSGALFIAASGQNLTSRDSNRLMTNYFSNSYIPYLTGGVALAVGGGVMVAGGIYNLIDGPVMVYSTDLGTTWSNVSNEFTRECAYINADNSSVWIATGSSGYRTIDFATPTGASFTTSTTTIKYSTNQGQTWYDSSNGFNMFGYEIAHANGTWLATGVTAVLEDVGYCYTPELWYSTNGVNWIRTDLTDTLFNQSNIYPSNVIAPLRVGSMNFDGTYWNVFVNEETPENGRLRLYRHDTASELETGWFPVDISGSLTTGQPEQNSNMRFLNLKEPRYLYTGAPPTAIQLNINTNIGGGPTFTSPITTSYLLYQYMPIPPIQISATGTGQVYLFVETADLPPGLTYSRVTNQITGAPVRLGTEIVTFYAQDINGITTYVLEFNTVVPRVIRKQDGAGAYTSLLRQYTEVLGAQNARDNRALPNQERTLGEFMSPDAPDVVTQTVDPKCFDPKCLR